MRQQPRKSQWQADRLAEQNNIFVEYSRPGKPQKNAYIERFNRTVRYENGYLSMAGKIWKKCSCRHELEFDYNHKRPNMALCGFTPKQRLDMAA